MTESLKVYPVCSRGTREEVITIELQFIKIWAVLGGSRTDAINRIWFAGLKALAESEELEGKIDKRAIAIIEKWREIIAGSSTNSMLEQIYENTEYDVFVEFCKENEIDHEKFLKDYRLKLPDSTNKSKVMADWLKYTLADGNEYRAVDIKEAAEIDRVIVSESDWSLMKHVASREGYSSGGKHGYWRKIKS